MSVLGVVCAQEAAEVEASAPKAAEFADQLDVRIAGGFFEQAQGSYGLLFGQLEVLALTAEVWLEECADAAPVEAVTVAEYATAARSLLDELVVLCRTELEQYGYHCYEPAT